MEEHKSSSPPAESAAALSASALRELQQRARAALADSREQAARLEADLTRQLDELATALHDHTSLETQAAFTAASFQAEIDRVAKELDDSRAAWLKERTALESQREELVQKAADLEQRLEKQRSELETNASEFKDSHTAWNTERAQLESQRDELVQKVTGLNEELSTHRDELTRSASLLEEGDAAWKTERTHLESQRDKLIQKVADLESRIAADNSALAKTASELEDSQSGWSTERAQLESQRDELIQKAAELEKRVISQQDELTKSSSELNESRAAWLKVRADLESHRDELAEKLASAESQLQAAQDDWHDQLLDFENRLREQQDAWNEQRDDWSTARAGLERDRTELQQKFDLALQDVQRLRGRIAELEQDLARRPESTRADSAELVALRAERDALADRVQQLEQRPATEMDPNVEQQLSDLQRRFEMAVEDVRELKTQNAELESRLTASSKKSTPPADAGGMDWESQKRRLLASLEDGSDSHETPAQKKERATIENTIEMTDAIVAEKDRLIAQLQTQLANGSEGAACQIERDPDVKELIDNDEIIAEHRRRVAELEQEMEQKLRTAELELSVERAKIARQKVELEELRSDLTSQQQAFESAGGAPIQGQPRRRWLSKLGLTGEE